MPRSHSAAIKRIALNIFVSCVALCVLVTSSQARGGGSQEDRWHPQHLNWLPPEIQNKVLQHKPSCGAPAAAHQFALSFDGGAALQFITLHYENFRCDNPRAICTDEGCLHEIFATKGGTYRLVQRIYAHDIEMKFVNQRPAITIDRAYKQEQIMFWSGRRFVPILNGSSQSGW